MATIHREIQIEADPDRVWAAVRDAGAVHERLAPGFVVDVRYDGTARDVTFANGMVVRELIVTIDDDACRLAYTAINGRSTHHNASMQVFANGEGSRLVWITDLLPNEVAEPVRGMVEQGLRTIKQTLERAARGG